jgi:preprotein translocase subunit SecG
MITLIVIVHVIVCVALVIIVLLQAGKGAEIGAAFGGASQTIFGSSGSGGFMSKLTTGAAIIFMLTCLSLSYFAAHRGGSTILTESAKKQEAGQPIYPPVQPAPNSPTQPAGIPQVPQSPAPVNPAGQP